MARAKKLGKRREALRGRYVAIRFTEDEYQEVLTAADPYPLATWSRVELLRVAREKATEQKKGGKP